jgi:hypothetical protein
MPKQRSDSLKKRIKWTRENLDFKYTEPSAARIALEKKKEEEFLKEQEKKDALWCMYFGFDGTCLSHDILACRECRVPATGRCYSSFEE